MMLARRSLLLAAGATAVGVAAPRTVRAADPFTQPKLPFAEDALAPSISGQTVGLHYGKHHAAYFTQLNKLTAGTPFAEMTLDEVVVATAKPEHQKIFNQAGQAWNHILYWEQMTPGGAKQPSGDLAAMIDRDLGGVDKMMTDFATGATAVFGSGWYWLVKDGDRLTMMGTSNGDNPLAHGQTALLGVDVWEHAYYLDYQNRRSDHVKAVMGNLINWDKVAERAQA